MSEQINRQRPTNWFVDAQVIQGIWREQMIAPEVNGIARPVTVFRAARRTG